MINFSDKKAVADWLDKSEKGQKCFLPNCETKPIVKCGHCELWACALHSYAFKNKQHES